MNFPFEFPHRSRKEPWVQCEQQKQWQVKFYVDSDIFRSQYLFDLRLASQRFISKPRHFRIFRERPAQKNHKIAVSIWISATLRLATEKMMCEQNVDCKRNTLSNVCRKIHSFQLNRSATKRKKTSCTAASMPSDHRFPGRWFSCKMQKTIFISKFS